MGCFVSFVQADGFEDQEEKYEAECEGVGGYSGTWNFTVYYAVNGEPDQHCTQPGGCSSMAVTFTWVY